MTAELAGTSRFADILDLQVPGRVVRLGPRHRQAADVLFLDEPRDIRVCARPGEPGRTRYTVVVDGRQTDQHDAGQYATYPVSSQYFVIAWDQETSIVLQRGLGLAPAEC